MKKTFVAPRISRFLFRLISVVALVVMLLSATQLLNGIGAVLAGASLATGASLSATKTDALKTDADSSGGETPGDTLTYTVVVQNNGGAAATNAVYSDTIDSHTSLVASSLRTTPIARNDGGYSTVGNVALTVGAPGVLPNDNDPDGTGSVTPSGVSGCTDDTAPFVCAGASANGGDVTLNTDGSFTYNPAPGYSGSDTFTYTVKDSDNNTDTATVSITVGQVVWFIDNSAPVDGDGRFQSPFNSIATFNSTAADDPGDIIFLFEKGGGDYNGGITLLNNQQLIGQGVDLVVNSTTLVSATTNPTLTSGGAGVTVAQNNVIRGLDIGNTGGSGLFAPAAFVSLTVSDASILGQGRAINFNGGGVMDLSFDTLSSNGGPNGIIMTSVTGSLSAAQTVITNTTTGSAIWVSNSAAAFDFGNTSILNSSLNGVELLTSSGSTFIFDSLSINISGNTGLLANNSGTITVLGSSNVINVTGGTAVNLTDTTIGTSGVTFQSVSASGTTNGITLNNTGSGAFTVTGSGATLGSGGTIQNMSEDGVRLNSATNVTLKNMNINTVATSAGATCTLTDASVCNSGVDMVGATNVVLDRVYINGSGQQGLSGHNLNGFQFTNGQIQNAGNGNDEFGMLFSQPSGVFLIQDSTITQMEEGGIRLYKNSGTLNMTVQRATFSNNNALSGFGEDGFQLQIEGSATANILVDDSTFTQLQRDGVDAQVLGSSGAALNLTVQNSLFTTNYGHGGVIATSGNTAIARLKISGNTFTNTVGTAVTLVSIGTSTFDAQVLNNTITHPAPPATQTGFGIYLSQEENSNLTGLVQGNTTSGTYSDGVRLFSRLGNFPSADSVTGTLHVTVKNNNIGVPLSVTFGLNIQVQNPENLLCLNIGYLNNPGNNSAIGYPGTAGIRARMVSTGVMQVEGLALGAQTAATMATHLNSYNTSSPAATAITATSFTGVAAGTCRTAAAVPLPTAFAPSQQFAQPSNGISPVAATGSSPVTATQPFDMAALRAGILNWANGLVSALGVSTAHASGETIPPVSLGILDPGQQVTITFDVTVDTPAQASDLTDQVCNQGAVGADGLTDTFTDDPDTGTANDKTCTSLQTGTIIVAKDQVPDGSTDFGFTSDITGNTAFNVTGDTNKTISSLPAGTYTVTENDPASIFFLLTDLACDDGSSHVASSVDKNARKATVNLEPGETVICTFTDTALPTAVTDAATNVASNGATLNGTVNAKNNSTTVTFEYGLDTNYGSTVTADQSPVTGSSNTAVSKAISGLTPNKTYHYRVVAENSVGKSYGNDQTFTTGAVGPTVTTDAATSITVISATLNGRVNANNASTTVTFEYGLDTNYGVTVTADQSPVTGTTNTAVTKTLNTLSPNSTYHYRVVGQSIGGTTNGDDMTFTTSAVPPIVTTDGASGVGTTFATLNGTVNPGNASTTVTFEYGLDTNYGSTVTADQSPVTGTTNTAVSKGLSGLVPNTTYHYRVVGNSIGGTVNGSDMTFTTGKVAPTAITEAASAISSAGATLNGTVNANNDDTTVTFEYGLDTGYGTTVIADQSPVTGITDTAVSKAISGLLPNTTYHYRVVGENSTGPTNGSDMTFTTSSTKQSATFFSQGLYDGWILENGNNPGTGGKLNRGSAVFYVGDNSHNRQYRSILSFDTSAIPDNAVITKVTLVIQKAGQKGTDPFKFNTHGSLRVDIRKGKFHTLTRLQLADFQARASRNGVGTVKRVGGTPVYQATLARAAYRFINTDGTTQLRLRFSIPDNNDNDADYFMFYSGNADMSLAPQLIVEYEVP